MGTPQCAALGLGPSGRKGVEWVKMGLSFSQWVSTDQCVQVRLLSSVLVIWSSSSLESTDNKKMSRMFVLHLTDIM